MVNEDRAVRRSGPRARDCRGRKRQQHTGHGRRHEQPGRGARQR